MSGVATAVGLGTAAAGMYASRQSRSAAENAANRMADASQFRPWNINTDQGQVTFNGGNIYSTMSGPQRQLQDYLQSTGQGFLGQLGNLGATGGLGSGLQGAYQQYLNSPGLGQDQMEHLVNQAYGQAMGPNPFAGLQSQFQNASQQSLQSLGSFDPQTAAAQYTSLLRGQAQPENQRAVDSTVQNLFNRGRLGSSGGAEVLGRLAEAQNQQDLGFQLAGQQYGGAEQNRVAGLAQALGSQAGAFGNFGLQNQAQGMNTFGNLVNMDQSRINNRFINAMNMFGMGNSNMTQLGALGGSLINQSQGMNQNQLAQIGLGIDSGRATSAGGAAGSAMLPMVAQAQGNQASAYANMFGSALGAFGNYYQSNQGLNNFGSGATLNSAWGNQPVRWDGTQPGLT